MSDSANVNLSKPKELKALLIAGPDTYISSEILELYHRDDCLIVPFENKEDLKIRIEEVNYTLEKRIKENNFFIGDNTRIDINAHGNIEEKKHVIWLGGSDTVDTRELFYCLKKLSTNKSVYINMWSCFGSSANKDSIILPEGSIVITHGKAKYTSVTDCQSYAYLKSITRYLNNENLTPHLQYLYDQTENYESTTFNQIKNGEQIKFKSIRNPEKGSVAEIVADISRDKNLLEELKNHLNFETKRFYQEFKTELTAEQIKKSDVHIKTLQAEDAKNFTIGTLMNLCNLYGEMEMSDPRHTVILTKINTTIKNSTSETLNHSLSGNLPLLALLIIAENKNIHLIKNLLKNNANPNVKIFEGNTPIFGACLEGDKDVVNLLIEYGAEINRKNHEGETPLSLACQHGYLEIVKLLLDKGADPTPRDKKGKTALDYASENKEIKALLEANEIAQELVTQTEETVEQSSISKLAENEVIEEHIKKVTEILEKKNVITPEEKKIYYENIQNSNSISFQEDVEEVKKLKTPLKEKLYSAVKKVLKSFGLVAVYHYFNKIVDKKNSKHKDVKNKIPRNEEQMFEGFKEKITPHLVPNSLNLTTSYKNPRGGKEKNR